jgi:DNA-binding NarL/FixJ family response regulator
MPVPSEIVIVSSSPIFAATLQDWLQVRLDGVPCRVLDAGSAAPSFTVTESAVIVLVPLDWHEMIAWLPKLQKRFPTHPWLVLADLRLAGMFLSFLDTRRCTLVAPGALPERLHVSLQVLAEGPALFPPARLLDLFSQGLRAVADGQHVTLTLREVQCGCAASLGANNRQIAQALHLGIGTVKNHMHTLLHKLAIARREEAFAWFAINETAPPHGTVASTLLCPPPSRRRQSSFARVGTPSTVRSLPAGS